MRPTCRFPKGTSRLRWGRYSGRFRIYHVTTTTNDRIPWFSDFETGRLVVKALKREDDADHTRTLAFVVMPDHLHWLLQLTGRRDLSVVVNNVKSYSARVINRSKNRSGRLWQKGFYDTPVRREVDLVNFARYVVANPIRAGLVRTLRRYPLWDAIWV